MGGVVHRSVLSRRDRLAAAGFCQYFLVAGIEAGLIHCKERKLIRPLYRLDYLLSPILTAQKIPEHESQRRLSS
ncbi:MAG: hypothetical protein KME19_10275, partial [Microcoleus vaginatus WJT46-NPBG5]|nr:hypothetical protein [Microcoleus vaginatus WJT46-NPBG5]